MAFKLFPVNLSRSLLRLLAPAIASHTLRLHEHCIYFPSLGNEGHKKAAWFARGFFEGEASESFKSRFRTLEDEPWAWRLPSSRTLDLHQ